MFTASLADKVIPLSVVYSDGGIYSDSYNVSNIIHDDLSTYCSLYSTPIDVVLAAKQPFCLKFVKIKIPNSGYTSPLSEGFLYALRRDVMIDNLVHDLDDFDRSKLFSRSNFLFPDYVASCLFFHIDSSKDEFFYEYKNVIYPVKAILLRMTCASGTCENVDMSFIGLYGNYRGFLSGEFSWI